MYLRVVESTGGYVFLSVQISAYQWGWRYYYGDTIYPKSHNYPFRTGFNKLTVTNPNTYKVSEIKFIPEKDIDETTLLNSEDKKLFKKLRIVHLI